MVDLLTIHKAQSELKETKQELDRLRQENDDLKRRLTSTANITDIVTNAIGTTLQPAYETITNLEDEVRRLNEKVKLLQTTTPGKSPLTETVLVLGGYANGHDYSDKLYLLDNDSSSWKQLSLSLPYSTRYHGAVCLKKILYVFGGSLQGRSCNFLHRLTKEFQWERLTDMVDKRRYISNSSVALNGCIWAIGGKNDKNEDLKTVEKYDPDTKAWVLMQDMRQARFNAAATVIKGKIYVCGGASNGDLAIATVEFYDPQSGVWTYLSSMPFSRYNLALIADYTTLIVLGGRDCDQKTVGTCWKLNISDLKSDWKPMKLMATPRCMFTAFKRADRIHVAGGYDGQKWLKTVDVFDGEKWTAGLEMPVQLSAMASVSLPNRLAVELTDRFTK